MDDEKAPKKISFGFSKQLKKPISAPVKPPEEKVQFIDCLEGKSIKLRDGEEVEEKKPLIIPLKDKDRTSTAAVLARIAKEVEPDLQPSTSDEPVSMDVQQPVVVENETLEARAARELLEEARKVKTKEVKSSTLVVPVADNVKITGEKESTLEDYENIPIGDFGMAMLRGMGWQEGKGIGKSSKNVDLVLPKLRPKGMGLGADKVAMAPVKNEKPNGATNEEELRIIKGSFVKIIAGKHSGSYGQVSGFDEDSARLIVKAAIGGANINLSEFMVQAVTKDEYSKQSKVINAAKFEEYKMKEMSLDVKKENDRRANRDSGGSSERDSPSDRKKDDNYYRKTSDDHSRSDRRRDRDYDRRKEDRIDSYDYSRSKESYDSKHASRRYDSRRSSDNDDDHHRSRDSRNYPEDKSRRKQDSSSSSDEEPPLARRRDSDKKRKGKKKRRDRSRSKKRKDRSRSRERKRR